MTFDPTIVCVCLSSGQGTGLSDQVWSKSDVGKYMKKTCCQKEKEEEEEEEERKKERRNE